MQSAVKRAPRKADVSSLQRELDSAENSFSSFQYLKATQQIDSLLSACGFIAVDPTASGVLMQTYPDLAISIIDLACRVFHDTGHVNKVVQVVTWGQRHLAEHLTESRRAEFLRYLGVAYSSMYSLGNSLDHLDKAAELYTSLGQHDQACMCLADTFQVLITYNMSDEAKANLEKCLGTLETVEDTEAIIHVSRLAGLTLLHFGRIDESSLLLERAMQLSSNSATPHNMAQSALALAILRIRQSLFTETEQHLIPAFKQAEEHGLMLSIANIASQLGYLFRITNRLEDAFVYHSKALNIYSELELRVQWLREHLSLSDVHTSLGNYTDSVSLLEKVLAEVTPEHYVLISGTAHMCLGTTLYHMKHYDECEYNYRQAGVHAQQSGSRRQFATAQGNLGIAMLTQERFDEAFVLMQTAIDEFTALGSPSEAARHSMNLGCAYIDHGRFKDARVLIEKAIPTFRELQMSHELGSALVNYGRVFGEDGSPMIDMASSERCLLEALQVYSDAGIMSGASKAHLYLSKLYEDQQQLPECIHHLREHNKCESKLLNDKVLKDISVYSSRLAAMQAQHDLHIATLEHEAAMEQTRLQKELHDQRRQHLEDELASAVQDLARKNELLQFVLSQCKATESYVHGKGLAILDMLSEKVARNIISIEEATEIRSSARSVHQEWMTTFRTHYPSISEMEAKVAALIRMSLPSESIASALCISKRTVEFHRLNLRKKLGLTKQDDLRITLSQRPGLLS